MQAEIRTLVDISDSDAARIGRAEMILDRARWAASIFERYDREATMAIVDAVAAKAHEHSVHFAQKAVEESGFGVVAHKKIKNELTAHPLVDFYRDQDFVNARVDEVRKIV